jgi:hypothetical protein
MRRYRQTPIATAIVTRRQVMRFRSRCRHIGTDRFVEAQIIRSSVGNQNSQIQKKSQVVNGPV